ncbi:hypothetical protein AAC387_Pa05g3872 [Persea americana]
MFSSTCRDPVTVSCQGFHALSPASHVFTSVRPQPQLRPRPISSQLVTVSPNPIVQPHTFLACGRSQRHADDAYSIFFLSTTSSYNTHPSIHPSLKLKSLLSRAADECIR